jgi:hypothetical protein
VIFYQNFEPFNFSMHMAGVRIPEWVDEFSNCITRPRLHTSLLYIDPVKVRGLIAAYHDQIPKTPFTPGVNLFHPLVVPLKGKRYFYDTCSLLFNAIGGQSFEPKHKNTFFHFQFGTISDVVLKRLTDGNQQWKERTAILHNPTLGIGRWRDYDRYYETRMFRN